MHVICIYVPSSLFPLISQAVKRSRVKSKLRTQQTLERVNQLKTENELLEEKIKMLTKELGFLKDLFIAHAGIIGTNYYQIVKSSDISYNVCKLLFLCVLSLIYYSSIYIIKKYFTRVHSTLRILFS